jgi:hypothetical protein
VVQLTEAWAVSRDAGDQQQEVCMTFTILDPRTGQQVTITVPETSSVRR